MTRLSALMLSGLLFAGATTAKDLAPYGFKKFFYPFSSIPIGQEVIRLTRRAYFWFIFLRFTMMTL